ncbi:hypothetical protein TL16_g10649 [Triparma laevis f. inornata]|uniref:TNFR-Cys domain-containing protein n=1 Tax=Triparma laevis f. inornata TaxID=1714386 RepID=A0A9W7BIE7_9STRA|nr:hypothetical protein TL16_g10649 [Triparma laevis f. inornata]
MACPMGKISTAQGATSCTDCPLGKSMSSIASTACQDCIAGEYADQVGSSFCLRCPAGRFNSEVGLTQASRCWECNEGMYSLPGFASCESCPAGTWNDQDSYPPRCELCRIGKYSGVKSASCDDFEAGTYNLLPGSITCDTCPAGQKLNDAGNDCEVCPDGTYSMPGAVSYSDCFYADQTSHTCKECEIDTFSVGGCDACIVCPTGTDNLKGSSTCSPCAPGTITSGNTCQPCAKGEYANLGDTSCSACSGQGKYSDMEGSAVCKIVTVGMKPNYNRDGLVACDLGSASSGAQDECTSCDGDGQYTDELGLYVCKMAPAGKKPTSDRQGVESCELGSASFGAQDKCAPCVEGKYAEVEGSIICYPCTTVCVSGTFISVNCTASTKPQCEACQAGKASLGGQTSCDACKGNEHPSSDSAYCVPCQQHMNFSPREDKCLCEPSFVVIADGDREICVCKPGETLMGTTCELCEKGKWKSKKGVNSCNLCSNTLEGATTQKTCSKQAKDCICPRGTFDNEQGKCTPIKSSGIYDGEAGMSLTDLKIRPSFWRTSESSAEVRRCPVEEACVGSQTNGTDYCAEGHRGPYCNLCKDKYAPDAFGLCKSCDAKTKDVIFTSASIFGGGLIILGIFFFAKKKLGISDHDDNGRRRAMVKRFKNGLKIIFAGVQITASLPFVAPTVSLPESFKAVSKAAQIFNFNLFSFISTGCWLADFNFYDSLLGTTLLIMIVVSVLVFVGAMNKEIRSWTYTSAIAITYLTLPTITTTIFGVFPCDELDDESSFLRRDYSISCKSSDRAFWIVYGVLMVLVFPIGVVCSYVRALWMKREKLRDEQIERLDDPDLSAIRFLWDPYKPRFWNFEIVETIRRLLMTGVLSIIAPDSFTQLCAGSLISILFGSLLCVLQPYSDTRDNTIAILTNLQLVLVFMAASFMKYHDAANDKVDAEGVGYVLITNQIAIIGMFFGWASFQKDGMSRSSNTFAIGTLKGIHVKKKNEEEDVKGTGLELVERGEGGGGQVTVKGGGGLWPEPTNSRSSKFGQVNPLRGMPTPAGKNKVNNGRSNSSFDTFKNPNLALGGKGGSKKNKKNIGKQPPMRRSKFAIPKDKLEEAPISPPKIPPPPYVEDEDDDDDDVGPPPYPPPAAEASLPSPKPVCQWTEEWDTEFGAIYYLNIDGVTSTWDMPDDFWRDENEVGGEGRVKGGGGMRRLVGGG